MSQQHHDLVHELPQYKDKIHTLKTSNAHFRKLFDEYHDLNRAIESMESEVTPTATATEEQAKRKRLQLKDQMVAMMDKHGVN